MHAELVHVPHLCQHALTKATTLPTRLTTCSLCSPPSPSREPTDPMHVGTYTELPYHDGEDDELENEGG